MILKEWEHAGMTCVLRHGAFDAPCGYVAIPDSHPLSDPFTRKTIGENGMTALEALDVHRGITFDGDIESDPRNRHWIGFDMAHWCDFDELDPTCCVRTDEECIEETNYLAEQLANMKG